MTGSNQAVDRANADNKLAYVLKVGRQLKCGSGKRSDKVGN